MRCLPRIVGKLLNDRLDSKRAKLMEDSKWYRNSTSNKQLSNSMVSMNRFNISK